MADEKIIKQITIDIAGTEVAVTPTQAKELHDALASLLGLEAKPVQQIIERHHYDRHYPYWPYPGLTWTSSGGTAAPFDKWRITYADTTARLSVND